MSLVLGVEGGGSHTHSVVADASGAVLGAAATRDPANWEDVGIEAAGAALRACVRTAVTAAGVSPAVIAASVFSLAGVDFPLDKLRLSGIPEALGLMGHRRIMNDAFSALRAGTERPFGVVVVAGTGSVVAGRDPRGEEFRTLGLGPLFGDSGSSTEISEAGVSAVAAAFTGRGSPTALTRHLCEAAGMPSVIDFLEAAGRGRIDNSQFGPLVDRAAVEGDAVAREILWRTGHTLGEAAVHVVRKLGMERLEFDLVLAGGAFRSTSLDLIDALEGTVRAAAPSVTPVRLEVPPVVGSVLLAIELAGSAPGPGTRTALAHEAAAGLGLPPSPGSS